MSILVLTSDTLIGTPATGNLEYNGQFYGTDSAASRAQLQRITQGTSVASTSGTSIDFTGIPAWAKRVTVMFRSVSTNGTSNLLIQIGAGSVTTSGYSSAGWTTNTTNSNSTIGYILSGNNGANYIWEGNATLCLLGSNIWTLSSVLGIQTLSGNAVGAGSISLGGTLDRVRITTVNGTDAYDAGSINIMYEG